MCAEQEHSKEHKQNQNATPQKKLAIIGAGISGLGCAYHLRNYPSLEVTIFEKENRLGGHSNTIDFQMPGSVEGSSYGIDTGFLVFNRRTYPRLVKLFEELQVPIAESEMTFSVSLPTGRTNKRALEWSGTNLNSVFAQRRNLLNRDFLGMLKDIVRFNKLAKNIAKSAAFETYIDNEQQTVLNFLNEHSFGIPFRNWYLLPMIGAIWSCPVTEMMHFPIKTLIHFCDNHGLLNIVDRPQWLTVKGGSREYVARLVSVLASKGVSINHDAVRSVSRSTTAINGTIQVTCESGQSLNFDEVVFACHSDQAMEILKNPCAEERQLLSSIPYQSNTAYVHTDESLLPANKRAWAAWNYSSNSLGGKSTDTASHVCVHYLLNKLQPLPNHLKNHSIIVSLNPHQIPKAELTHSIIHYSHPLFDAKAVKNQKQLPMIQGKNNTWYCGAWSGYGFHEDGLRSGELVAFDILESLSIGNLNKTFRPEPI